jgi:hypothetical protein
MPSTRASDRGRPRHQSPLYGRGSSIPDGEEFSEERNRGCDPTRALAMACPHLMMACWRFDNSAAERALCAVAFGRKNYLFAGFDRGGERAAAIYSLIGSAKLNGLDPESHLSTVLSQIADQSHRGSPSLEPSSVFMDLMLPSRLDTLIRCPQKR